MIYVVIFISSSVAAQFVQKSKGKKAKIAWTIICIMLPSIFLGGLRSNIVGTDNYLYYSKMFKKYCFADSIANIPSISNISQVYYEPLFSLLMYVVSRFTSDYHWFCCITVLIEMFLVLQGILYFKDDNSTGFTMLAFYLMYFCPFINLVRQSLAVAVCIYSLKYCFERNLRKFLICVLVAIGFHVTAIVFLLAYIVTSYKNIEFQKGKLFWLIAGILMFYLFSPFIGNLLMNIGYLRTHYASYLSSTVSFKLSQFIYRIPLVLLMGFFLKKLEVRSEKWYSIFLLLIVDIVLSQMAGIRSSGVRIAYYYGVFAVPCYSGICRTFQIRSNRVVAYCLALIFLVIYWLYWVVFNNFAYSYPVFPYVSDIIKWLH